MIGIILIVLVLAGLVIAHEAGHFVMARRNGVRVDEFGVGFPPRLWARKHGETEYSINLLPLGGFVRMAGEDGTSQVKGTFAASSLGAKTKILLAGVIMNFLVAWILLSVLAGVKLPDIGSLAPNFLPHHDVGTPQLMLTEVVKGSPAEKAGLHRGDRLLSLNGKPLTTEAALHDATRANAGKQVELVVEVKGRPEHLGVTLRRSNESQLGVASQRLAYTRYSWWAAPIAGLWIAGAMLVATIMGVVMLIVHLPSLIGGLFHSGVPSAASDVSGPVGIVAIAQGITLLGPAYAVLLIANISVALAGFNVLPLPALDGGRWAVAATRKLLHGRISAEAEARWHLGGMAALLLVVILSVYDLRKFF